MSKQELVAWKEPPRNALGLKRALGADAIASLKSVCPRGFAPEKMVRLALSWAVRQPKLYDCTSESILLSLMVAAKLGLEPDGAHGVWLVPYGNACTVVPDYRGLMTLARRSGEIASWDVDVVREHDFFESQRGTDRYLRHRPSLTGDPGEVVAAYSYVRFKDGGDSFVVMSKSELDHVKNKSRASGSGPWKTDETEMQKKTIIKRHCKILPYSTEDLRVGIGLDNEAETGERASPIEDAARTLDIHAPDAEPEKPEEKPALSLEERRARAAKPPEKAPEKTEAQAASSALPGFEEERGDAYEGH